MASVSSVKFYDKEDDDTNVFTVYHHEIDEEPSFDSVTSNSLEDSPMPPDPLPLYLFDGSSNSTNGSLMILDRTPSTSPNTSTDFDEEHGFTDSSVAIDIRTMAAFKDQELKPVLPYAKGVKFLALPQQVVYEVSVDVVKDALIVPPKRYQPSRSQRACTALELIDGSERLQYAASSALVRSDPVDPVDIDDGDDSDDGKEDIKEDDESSECSHSSRRRAFLMQLIRVYLDQDLFGRVCFDKIAVTGSNRKVVLLSSQGFSSGRHEWSVKIERTDVDLAEIGVVGVCDIDQIAVSDDGVFATNAFQSRAVYGNEMSSGELFYCSYNANGHQRCRRDLRPFFKVGWTVGDVVTVIVDLTPNRWRIKYLLNGDKVRHTMSLEPNKEYFPIICFSGNCKYSLQGILSE